MILCDNSSSSKHRNDAVKLTVNPMRLEMHMMMYTILIVFWICSFDFNLIMDITKMVEMNTNDIIDTTNSIKSDTFDIHSGTTMIVE